MTTLPTGVRVMRIGWPALIGTIIHLRKWDEAVVHWDNDDDDANYVIQIDLLMPLDLIDD